MTGPEIGNFSRSKITTKDTETETEDKSGASEIVTQFLAGGPNSSFLKEPQPKPTQAPQVEPQKDPDVKGKMDDIDTQIEAISKRPEIAYEKKLEKHNVSISEAEEIVDSMILRGVYKRRYDLTKKYYAVFKTRNLGDQNSLLERLELSQPRYPSTADSIVSQYNIAASIVDFCGKTLEDTPFTNRLEWVKGLPGGVVIALAQRLSKFDELVTDVLSDGAAENF